MSQLNKWEKELEELTKRRYKQMDSEVHNHYKKALREVKKELSQYIGRYDDLSFSQRLQLENQFKSARQIDSILSEMSEKSTGTIEEYVRDELRRGYNGVWYTIESMENIRLDFGMLPEEYIEQLVHQPVEGMRFSQRLYAHRTELAEQVTDELLRGARRGEGYAKVAKRIGEMTEADYKQALVIARTEGGRTQSTAKQKSYEEAERLGVRIQKQWIATLDEKTRSNHATLDGQTVDIDDDFEIDGYAAKGPRLFGVAKQDVNCRCTTITVVNGISPTTRLDNITDEVIDYVNYDEWAMDRL